jgi:hypothetical protein
VRREEEEEEGEKEEEEEEEPEGHKFGREGIPEQLERNTVKSAWSRYLHQVFIN